MQVEIELGARLGRSITKSTTSTVTVPKPHETTFDIPIEKIVRENVTLHAKTGLMDFHHKREKNSRSRRVKSNFHAVNLNFHAVFTLIQTHFTLDVK